MVGVTALMAVGRYLGFGIGHIAAFEVLHVIRMRSYDQLKPAATQANLIPTCYFAGVEWMAAIPVALVLLVGGLMAHARQLSIPDLVLFVFLTTLLYRPVTELNRQLEGLRNAEAATDRIFEILNAPIEVKESLTARVPKDRRYDIALDHVTFAYEPGRSVLHDVSVDLEDR